MYAQSSDVLFFSQTGSVSGKESSPSDFQQRKCTWPGGYFCLSCLCVSVRLSVCVRTLVWGTRTLPRPLIKRISPYITASWLGKNQGRQAMGGREVPCIYAPQDIQGLGSDLPSPPEALIAGLWLNGHTAVYVCVAMPVLQK